MYHEARCRQVVRPVAQCSNLNAARAGVPVQFPYEAYPCQIEFMKSVIGAVATKQNALLESPTGTVRRMLPVYAARLHDATSRMWSLRTCAAGQNTVPALCHSWVPRLHEDSGVQV